MPKCKSLHVCIAAAKRVRELCVCCCSTPGMHMHNGTAGVRSGAPDPLNGPDVTVEYVPSAHPVRHVWGGQSSLTRHIWAGGRQPPAPVHPPQRQSPLQTCRHVDAAAQRSKWRQGPWCIGGIPHGTSQALKFLWKFVVSVWLALHGDGRFTDCGQL